MTNNVLHPSDAPVTLDILVNGKRMSPAHELLEVQIEHEVNRIPLAHVTIADDGLEQGQFAALSSGEFEQGNQIEVRLGRNGENATVFTGLILSRQIKASESGQSSLVLRCGDETIKTTGHQTSRLFQNVPDSAVIESLIRTAGLACDVETTPTVHAHQLTGSVNDWVFILSLAGANGQVAIVRDGKVSVKTPSMGDARLAVEFGTSIIRMDLEEQPLVMAGGQRKGSPLARVRGTLTIPGHAALGPDDAVKLAGFGAPFDGSCYVRGVRHLVARGLWTTEVELGLPETSSGSLNSAVRPLQAAGPQAAMRELQIAEVIRTRAGDAGRGLVEVRLPQLSDDAGGVWVRTASPYATENAGIEFMPEAGDTVIVAFVGGDVEAGVILGSLHTSSSPTPLEPDWPNSIKSIVSRSQLKIAFDDEHEILVIETPGGHRVTLSDDEKLVAVADSSGNSMELRATGMAFTSPGDIAISAGGTVSIEARSGIRISTAADAEIGGANVSITAQVGLTAKGMASAELSASGQTTVKGAMVMIN